MPVTVTCECGHVTELADSEQPVAASPCSVCGRPLMTPAPAGKRMFQKWWRSHAGDESAPMVATTPPVTEAPAEPIAIEPPPPRRSLWEVMRGSTDVPREERDLPAEDSVTDAAPPMLNVTADAVKPKGLWGVMHAPAPTSLAADEKPMASASSETASTEVVVEEPAPAVDAAQPVNIPAAQPELSAEKKYALAASLATMTHLQSSWRPEPEPEPFDEEEREWSRRAIVAIGFAAAAVMVSMLSYRSEWWWRFPALVVGLIAVVLGFMASSDTRRSRGRLKGRWCARASVLLGTFGMFLAPIVFAGLGERARENAGREEIDWRLRRIGQGLDQYHTQQGQFPEASVKGRNAHGDKVPMHGWMTPLLPSLGYEAIYQRIDLQQPYDAPANVAAMQQPIPEFLLPRRKHSRSPRGFALTHFAGVGGQDVREPVGLVHLGLFNDGGPVRQADFTDGQSQTIIVGEIRDTLPPWGEPGNVRAIGEGLNRQFRGFGNENGTGATFLHADGSVKFYSNKIDRRVLERLETRDGAEPE